VGRKKKKKKKKRKENERRDKKKELEFGGVWPGSLPQGAEIGTSKADISRKNYSFCITPLGEASPLNYSAKRKEAVK